MTNWYKELQEISANDPIVAITVRENKCKYGWEDDGKSCKQIYDGTKWCLEAVRSLIDYEFDDSYGGEEGCSFTAWTKDKVYFPACYDGSEWIASVPRNPCDEPKNHVGGG